eukprot:NODE_499_length_6752_cov_0.698482.p1 type:complete len:620 gc:universal NODE_499_length_6752_cov_0.698482:5943-4084(-)
MQISAAVKSAISKGLPVVALESTIISHGMPFPQNFETALKAEAICKSLNVVPATVGMLDGSLKVGLSSNEIKRLATEPCVKLSRRDISYCSAKLKNGGTTVSATMYAAHQAGIKVFSTGGIGGVHRNYNETFDLSADLFEFSRSRVAVVASGVKSILDIPKSLEYLESLGVPVINISHNKEFPAFYHNKSGHLAPYNEPDISNCAKILKTHLDAKMNGIFFSNPIPEEHKLNDQYIENVIDESLRLAEIEDIKGKDLTPFLLSKLNEMTKGLSLKTNIQLYYNNVRTGSILAKNLAKELDKANKSIFIFGGINLDTIIEPLNLNDNGKPSSQPSKISTSIGGVGYNIFKNTNNSDGRIHFCSVVGNDTSGLELQKKLEKTLNAHIYKENLLSGRYFAILNEKRDVKHCYSNTDIMSRLSTDKMSKYLNLNCRLALFDANINKKDLNESLSICKRNNIVTAFEPISIEKCTKIIPSIISRNLDIIFPNLLELDCLITSLDLKAVFPQQTCGSEFLDEYIAKAIALSAHVPLVLAKFGSHGMCLIEKCDSKRSFESFSWGVEFSENCFKGIYVKSLRKSVKTSVVGAGDAAAAAFIVNYGQVTSRNLIHLCNEASSKILSC